MLKLIVLVSLEKFAALIASRNVQPLLAERQTEAVIGVRRRIHYQRRRRRVVICDGAKSLWIRDVGVGRVSNIDEEGFIRLVVNVVIDGDDNRAGSLPARMVVEPLVTVT